MILKKFILPKYRKSQLLEDIKHKTKDIKREGKIPKFQLANFNLQSGASNKIKWLKHTIVEVPKNKIKSHRKRKLDQGQGNEFVFYQSINVSEYQKRMHTKSPHMQHECF